MLITSHPGHNTVDCAGIELATFGLDLVGGRGRGGGGEKERMVSMHFLSVNLRQNICFRFPIYYLYNFLA